MPKEVIHDDTRIAEMDLLCQCAKHSASWQKEDIGGRQWIDHDMVCDESCQSILSSDHVIRWVKSERGNSTPFAVEVAWGRDTHLQLATIDLPTAQGEPSKELTTVLQSLGELAELATRADAKEATRWKATGESAAYTLQSKSTGLFVDMDRDRTNKLIKTLKRARDQAFGADE